MVKKWTNPATNTHCFMQAGIYVSLVMHEPSRVVAPAR